MMWFYQLSQKKWSPERFRYEIWENQKWHWPVWKRQGWNKKRNPQVGDTIVFFYAKSSGMEPGFYGWAIIVEYRVEEKLIYFIPVAPTNFLKMCPWWDKGRDKSASKLANEIRGSAKEATTWAVKPNQAEKVQDGIRRWVSGAVK